MVLGAAVGVGVGGCTWEDFGCTNLNGTDGSVNIGSFSQKNGGCLIFGAHNGFEDQRALIL